jgi:hypothetical protein
MDIKFKPPGGTVGLNPITGDTIVDWDKYFAQNFNNIDNFIGAMAKNWPTIGVTAGLVVTAGTGMTISVSKGGAVIQGHFFTLDAAQSLTVLPADPTYNRIDLVVVHLDWAKGDMSLSVIKGTAADIYSPAQITTNDSVWEIPLAEIVVNTGVSSITSTNITDKRFFVRNPTTQQVDFIPATFQNAWINYGNGYAGAGFTKDEFGWVTVKGMIYNGILPGAAFVLPAGYRPAELIRFSTQAHNGSAIVVAGIDISTSGNVTVAYGGTTWVSLNGIRFLAKN